MKKVLFIASHRRDRSPNQRFRFEQYFSWLEENGFACELSYLISEGDDAVFYGRGNYHLKANILRKSFTRRLQDLARLRQFDLVFVCREALMTGSAYVEKKIAASGIPMIYDFDDAIWMNSTSDANRLFKWMKRPSKTAQIIGLADLVFAGNAYLADYARTFNKQVQIVPTTIDTGSYTRENRPRDPQKIVIGWSGSITTIRHFNYALPFLTALREKYGDRLEIKVIGDGQYKHEALGIQGLDWSRESEIHELSSFDIGIMPLPDDPWARGKCGLKGLQYMALSIPTIMSPVGVNTEIIRHGENGFLADTPEEWIACIEQLMHQPELRETMGNAARRTVEEKYSVIANRDKYLSAFRMLTSR